MRKRSSYRPRNVIKDPLGYVLAGFIPIKNLSPISTVRIAMHDAMSSLVKGNGTSIDVEHLSHALNVAYALSTYNLGGDWLDEITKALNACKAMTERGMTRTPERYLFRGEEITLINQALEVHELQLEKCNVNQIEKAMLLVKEALRIQRKQLVTQHSF